MRSGAGLRSLRHNRTVRRHIRIATGFVLAAMLALAAGCGAGEPADTGTPTPGPGEPRLRVEPPVTSVGAGERLWVEVRLEDGFEAEGVGFEITFDPRYVLVEDSVPDAAGVQIRVDSLCDSPLNVRQSVVENEVDNEAGVIRFSSTWSLSRQLCGDALVASIGIRGVAEGGCPVRFAAAGVVGPDGETSPVERPGNGLVLVDAAEGTPEPGSEAQPTGVTPAGTSILTGGVYHTVESGETLFGIAIQYGTTVDAIVEANGLTDPDAVGVGQRLLIPPSGDAVDAPAEDKDDETTYVVQAGDTLSAIAARLGTTIEALAELNDLEPPYDIVAGDTLRVP